MSDEKFDCIVVGGGLAGLTAAYVMAGAGREVMLVERGNYCGSKNVTGGRMYTHSMEKVIPGFTASAPLGRKIVRERLSTAKDGVFVTKETESTDPLIAGGESYAVERAKFDRWLAEQCEEMGVIVISDILVDDICVEDGRVSGIVANGEPMEAELVILAEGVNGLLAQKLGMKEAITTEEVAVGIKEVFQLSPEVIDERFGLAEGEGIAWMINDFDGVGDAFLYTNKDSLSLGVTMTVHRIADTDKSTPEMLDDFINHPEIAPLIEGGSLIEHSAHLFPEGKIDRISKLYGDGVMVVGDAAGLCVNFGETLRGMDLAVESGRIAAETAVAALEAGDCTAAFLSRYETALKESCVYSIMKAGE